MPQLLNDNYDLEERTAKFGEDILKFIKGIQENNKNKPIISQLVRLATSIGANYMEACGAESKKDFIHKISISKKEARETKHWLRMLAVLLPSAKNIIRKLWQEAHELTLIFSKIIRSSREKNRLK